MRKSIVSLILIMAAVAITFTWTVPVFEGAQEAALLRDAFDNILENSRKLQESRDSLLSEYNLVSPDDLYRISKIAPENSETNELIFQFSNIAQTEGFTLDSFVFEEVASDSVQNLGLTQESVAKPGHRALKIEFSFTSSYETFRLVLSKLESSLRLMDIDSIELASTDDEGSYEFDITGNVYFEK